MKQAYLIFSLVIVLSGLAGCSSISPEECRVGDWFAIGKTDGQQGVASSKFRDYQKECAAHGLTSDYSAYEQGHKEGALLYCTYDQGIEVGQQGSSYNKLCSGALEPQFRIGYERGRKWYQAESALTHLQASFEQNAKTIQAVEQRVEDNNQQLAATKSEQKKQQLLDENRELQKQLRQLNQMQGQLQQELKQAEFQFGLLQQGEAK